MISSNKILSAARRYLEHKKDYIIDDTIYAEGNYYIVTWHNGILTFVRVDDPIIDGSFEESNIKRKTMEKVALDWFEEHDICDVSVRFDIITMRIIDDDRAFLRHHINAVCTTK